MMIQNSVLLKINSILVLFLLSLSLTISPAMAAELSDVTKRLFLAVNQNDLVKVRSSVSAGADVDAVNDLGETPAGIAVDKGYFDIAHFILLTRQQIRLKATASPEPKLKSAPPPRPEKEQIITTSEPPQQAVPAPREFAAPVLNQPDPFDPKTAIKTGLPVVGPIQRSATEPIASSLSPFKQEVIIRNDATEKNVQQSATAKPSALTPLTAAPANKKSKPSFFDRIKEALKTASDKPAETQISPPVEQATVPVEKAPEPIEPVDVLVEKAPAPVEPTAVPEEKTPEPAEQVAIPDEQAPAPVKPTAVPEEKTPEPVEQIAIPDEKAPAPVKPAAVPEEETPEPVEQVAVSNEKAPAPVEPATVTVEEAPTPVEPAAVPDEKAPAPATIKQVVVTSDKQPTTIAPQQSPETNIAEIQEPIFDPSQIHPARVAGDLSLSEGFKLGQKLSNDSEALNNCFQKSEKMTWYCLENITLPENLLAYFDKERASDTSLPMLVRYNSGESVRIFTSFPSKHFSAIRDILVEELGEPTSQSKRKMALISSPNLDPIFRLPLNIFSKTPEFNSSVKWTGGTSGAKDSLVLELRRFDNVKEIQANIKQGVLRLYRRDTMPIYHYVSAQDIDLLQEKLQKKR